MIAPQRRVAALTSMAACLALAACGAKDKPAAAAPAKPAKVETIGHESELLKLTLTPEAETRLGLTTVPVGQGTSRKVRMVHGEVVVAPPVGGVPTSSTTDLATLGANQARADGDVARIRAEFEVAQKAYARADALVKEEAGSVRARDEAEAALGAARANLTAAQAQRALLGPRVAGLGSQQTVWIRAAAFAADVGAVDRAAPATVRGLGADGAAHTARPANGPPSANLTAGTVDIYYSLPNPGNALRVGQRVAVELPLRGEAGGMQVPASAILRDIYGGEWVYVRTAPHTYERRRIEASSFQGGQVLLRKGLAAGAEVVTAGAMELYGTEFGSK